MSGAGDGGDKREDVCPEKGEGGELVGAPAGGFCFHSERGSEFMDGEPNGEKTGQVWGVRGSMRIIEWMERRNTPGQHCWTPGSLQSSRQVNNADFSRKQASPGLCVWGTHLPGCRAAAERGRWG